MSFLNSIKRSLGFETELDDELLNDSDDVTTDKPHIHPDVQDGDTRAETNTADVIFDPDVASHIFDRVIALFNGALPSFLKDTVNADAERKVLFSSLDESIKDYLRKVTADAAALCEERWKAEQSSLKSEMESLKAKSKEIEQQRFDIKQQQLSADRQRRALTERVHDLETQLSTMAAEHEQLDLENKSLLNRLKVAAVHEKESDSLREDLETARTELIALRNASPAPSSSSAPGLDEVLAQLRQLQDDNTALTQQLDAAVEKDRLATEMLNGLQSKASAARAELAERDQEIDTLQKRLKEAESLQADIAQLNDQMTLVEDAIAKRDTKITSLKEQNASLKQQIASLNDTIAANLRQHASEEEHLRARIADLESDITAPIAMADLADASQNDDPADDSDVAPLKISDCDLAAIEESFDSADWMRSDPPVTPSMRSGVNESEFGYQAPVKKSPQIDNDAQLSLF